MFRLTCYLPKRIMQIHTTQHHKIQNERETMNLIEIRKAQPEELPLAKNTIYKFHSIGRYPGMILKVAGKLFFDIDAWEQMVEETRAKQIKKSAHLQKM